ncbi:MAG: hypothetical protein H0T15_00585, partial [Thermoleophilaceae bacterium]|nr:hypothetical protein [Thermoleophilaceae bacterium]
MPRAHLAVVGALLLAGVLIAAFWLASSERRFAATNSVAPRAVTAGLGSGEELCLEDIWMPAGANAFRLWLATPGAPVSATLSLGRQTATREVRGSDLRPVDFALTPRSSGGPVRACVRGEGLALAGTSGPNYDGQTGVTIDGRPHGGRVAAWFLEPQETSLASTLAGAARRAALFKPGWVGPWSFPVLFALSMGLCALGMWALLRAPPRRALLIVGVATFGNAVVWSLLTPAFQG